MCNENGIGFTMLYFHLDEAHRERFMKNSCARVDRSRGNTEQSIPVMLTTQTTAAGENDHDNNSSDNERCETPAGSSTGGNSNTSKNAWKKARLAVRRFLSSRVKHWVILTLIVLDVLGILADIFIGLIMCELNREDEPWVAPARDGLTEFSLVMSCLFMVELGLSVFADGLK